ATITDVAGNTGTSSPIQILKATPPWGLVGDPHDVDPSGGRGPDPIIGDPPPRGDGALLSEAQQGSSMDDHALPLDQSSSCNCDMAELMYDSATVSTDQPIVQATVQTNDNPTLPSSMLATLTWDVNDASPTVTAKTILVPASAAPGDLLTFGIQTSATVASTGRHAWKLDVSFTVGSVVNLSITGSSFVVTRDSSAFGSGWGLSTEHQLVDIPADPNNPSYPAGKLLVYGNGLFRFYSGTTTFTSMDEDKGTLILNGDNTFTYRDPEGYRWNFDTGGKMTARVNPDGQGTLTFTYSGSNLSGMVARDGSLTTFTYASGRIATIQAPGNRTVTLTYSGTDLSQINDPDGGLHTFSYDGSHRITGETFGTRRNNYAYNASGLLTTVTRGATSSGAMA